MYNWHRQILAIGMKNPESYRRLPVIGNQNGLRKKFNALTLWPLLFTGFGVYLFCFRRRLYRDAKGRRLGKPDALITSLSIILIAGGTIFTVNNYPFCDIAFTQYQGDLKEKPYQNYIDYVNKNNGLTFWAHPDAENTSQVDNIKFKTAEHSRLLLQTHDYTGFCIFYDGYKITGRPGGVWDRVLTQYCRGRRTHPVWAIGGMSIDDNDDLMKKFKDLQTVILVKEKTRRGILESIKTGRMYVARGPRSRDFVLNEFYVSNGINWKKAGMGGHFVTSKKHVSLRIAADIKNSSREEAEITIIKEGNIAARLRQKVPFDIRWPFTPPENKGDLTCYRAEIRAPGIHIITNPIFVGKTFCESCAKKHKAQKEENQ